MNAEAPLFSFYAAEVLPTAGEGGEGPAGEGVKADVGAVGAAVCSSGMLVIRTGSLP